MHFAAAVARSLTCLTNNTSGCLLAVIGGSLLHSGQPRTAQLCISTTPAAPLRRFASASSGNQRPDLPGKPADNSKPDHHSASASVETASHTTHEGSSSAAAAANTSGPTDTTSTSTSSSSTSVLNRYISHELVTDVSSTINKLTGYEGIDRLKATVATVDEALTACKRDLQAAKLEYDQQLAKQSQLHREVTALLQRKSSWVPADVSRFTELYAAEHETERAVAAAKVRHTSLSDDVDLLQLKLVDLIRERYQQEQAWSDKIRRASTWWTWGLMGLHFASFVAVYTVLEPHKRQALTTAVAGMLEQHTASIDTKLSRLAAAVVEPAGLTAAAAAEGGGADGSSKEQQRRAAGSRKQQLQHSSSSSSSQQQEVVATHLQVQSSAEVQQQVLLGLEKVQQQLQQLQEAMPLQARQQSSSSTAQPGASHSSPPGARTWWQLPSRQWVSQQVSAAGSAAGRSWQAVRSKGQEVSAHFNPLQALGTAGPGPRTAAQQQQPQQQPQDGTELQQQQQQQEGTQTTISDKPRESSRGQTEEVRQGQGEVQQHPSKPCRGISGFTDLLARLQRGGGGAGAVVEVTRGQLAVLGAAASSCGAVVGALLILLLRGSGAGGSGSAA